LTCLKAGGCGTNQSILSTEKNNCNEKKALRKEGRNEAEKKSFNDGCSSINY
jgi:hypothetical protein